MKKTIIAVLLLAVTFTSVYAAGGKEKKEKDIKVNIHIDKDGKCRVNGKNISDKEIEQWVNEHLKNISINIEGDTDDHPAPAEKKSKTVEVSLTIKEK